MIKCYLNQGIRVLFINVLLMLCYLLLHHPMLGLFSKSFLYKDIFSKIAFDALSIQVVIGLIVSVGVYLTKASYIKKHAILLQGFFLNIIILYLFEKYYFTYWEFVKTNLFDFDLMGVMIFGTGIVLVSKYVFVTEYTKTENDVVSNEIETKRAKIPISETHIESIDQDKFGYSSHVRKLLLFLQNLKSNDSFVVGINSKWGSGKSSFIKLLNLIYEDERKKVDLKYKEFCFVYFKPWFSHSSKDIINDFFDIFSKELDNENIKLQIELEAYKDALMGYEGEGFMNSLISTLKIFFGWKKQTTLELYNKINTELSKQSKRFVIVIDDLDRLDKEELFEVLKIVRNSAMFKNTFFVLAYDREYINAALKELGIGNSETYIEKIVQHEIKLPFLTKRELLPYMEEFLKDNYDGEYNELLRSVFRRLNIGKTISNLNKIRVKNLKEVKYEEQLDFFKIITSGRDIKRFLTDFMFDYLPIIDEVHFVDFFCLNLLKYKNKELYVDIYNQKDYCLVETRTSRYNLNRIDFIESYFTDNDRIKFHDRLLVNAIFALNDYNDPNKHINNPDRFETYFNCEITDNYMSDADFRFLLMNDSKNKYFDSKHQVDIVRKLHKIDEFGLPKDIISLESVLGVLNSLYFQLHQKEEFILDNCEELLFDILAYFKDEIESLEGYNKTVRDFFEINYPCVYRANALKSNNELLFFNSWEIIKFNSKYLELALKLEMDIDDRLMSFYYDTAHYQEGESSDRKLVRDIKDVETFGKYIKRNQDETINYIRSISSVKEFSDFMETFDNKMMFCSDKEAKVFYEIINVEVFKNIVKSILSSKE